MIRYVFILLIFGSFKTQSQNLVPNPSFEEFSLCPGDMGYGYYWNSWMSLPLGSIENYNLCGTNGFATPENLMGYQKPLEGNGYCGLALYRKGSEITCEFIQIKLNDTLKLEKTYQFEFNVSLADSYYYAINSICGYFSEYEILNSSTLIDVYPQICSSNYITDKQNWIKISGRYRATGGEVYLIIGNFNTSNNTDTLNVGGASLVGNVPFNKYSYYYIDQVSVIPVDSLNGIEEKDIKFLIYPNPAQTLITLQSPYPKQQYYTITNSFGQSLLSDTFTKEINIETADLPNGVYFVEVGGKREKLVVCR